MLNLLVISIYDSFKSFSQHEKFLVLKWIRENISEWREAVIVSPDAGGAKRFFNHFTS
jgi:phosphoribosylpyrophosphate synthetase